MNQKRMSAKVSFIVAMYNVAAYIEQCARSLFEQTEKDLEFIFVDDASPDNCTEIVRRVMGEYPERVPQVKIVRHEQNKKIIETRRDGLSAATGEYVTFIDGDDYVEPRMAELAYGKAAETGADMVLYDIYGYSKDGVQVVQAVSPIALKQNMKYNDAIIFRWVMPYLTCKMIKRDILTTNDIAWAVKSYGEDVVLSISAAYYTKKVEYLQTPLYHYRYNPQSITNSIDKERLVKNYSDYMDNMRVIDDFLTRKGVSDYYAAGLYTSKLNVRSHLLPLVGERNYRRMWFRCFPEINKEMFWGGKGHKSRFRDKLWYVCIGLGLYPRMRKTLVKRKFWPGHEFARGAFYFHELYQESLKRDGLKK